MVAVCVLAVVLAVIAPRVRQAFLDIERTQVERNVERARAVLVTELAALESTSHDWAAWDDTAAFVAGRGPKYVESNLISDTFVNLRLNAIAYYDLVGKLIFARGYDLEADEPKALSESRIAALNALGMAKRATDDVSSRAGLVSSAGQLALVAVHPVLGDMHEPPVLGTLVVVRVVTSEEIALFASQVQLPLKVLTLDEAENVPALAPLLLGRESPPTLVVPTDGETIVGYATWVGLDGSPVAVLAVDTPRDTYRAGVAALTFMVAALVVLLAVLATGFLVFVNSRVLARTSRLTADVTRITKTQDSSARVEAKGKDELADLGVDINKMLASIEESREALARSERQYRNLFESSRDPIYITTEDGQFVDVNQALVDLFGYTKAEVMALPVGELYVNQEDRDGFQAAIQDKGFVVSYPVTLKRKDGAHLHCLLTTALETAASGRGRVYQGIIRDVTELLRQQEKLAFLATHDPLTGLLTRGALDDVLRLEIARAMRNLERLAVFYLDLDRFKEVNDTHGHAVGDHVLQEVSARLRDALRASDTVARLGGDEFVALLPGIDSPRDAEIAADKILQALRSAFDVPDDGTVGLSVSIGIALFPDDGESGVHLLQKADAAMYAAKTAGRDGWRRYRRGALGPSQS